MVGRWPFPFELWKFEGFHIILSNRKNICVNLSLAAQGFNRSYGKCLGNPITHTLCPAEFPKDSRNPCVSGRGFAQEFPSNDESLGTVGKKVVRPRGRNSRTSRTSRASGSSILTQNHFSKLRVINSTNGNMITWHWKITFFNRDTSSNCCFSIVILVFQGVTGWFGAAWFGIRIRVPLGIPILLGDARNPNHQRTTSWYQVLGNFRTIIWKGTPQLPPPPNKNKAFIRDGPVANGRPWIWPCFLGRVALGATLRFLWFFV